MSDPPVLRKKSVSWNMAEPELINSPTNESEVQVFVEALDIISNVDETSFVEDFE
jgi:hypothetical protein